MNRVDEINLAIDKIKKEFIVLEATKHNGFYYFGAEGDNLPRVRVELYYNSKIKNQWKQSDFSLTNLIVKTSSCSYVDVKKMIVLFDEIEKHSEVIRSYLIECVKHDMKVIPINEDIEEHY